MADLSGPMGQWDGMNIDDTSVKIWIPEPLDDCLTALSAHFDQSKSDLARNGLMIHLHGRYVFEQLVANRLWKMTRRVEQSEPERKFCLMGDSVKLEGDPRPAFIKAFGKNTFDLKVWMPRKLQADLVALALDSGQTGSEYMRRALTAHYLGRTMMDPLKG